LNVDYVGKNKKGGKDKKGKTRSTQGDYETAILAARRGIVYERGEILSKKRLCEKKKDQRTKKNYVAQKNDKGGARRALGKGKGHSSGKRPHRKSICKKLLSTREKRGGAQLDERGESINGRPRSKKKGKKKKTPTREEEDEKQGENGPDQKRS